MTERYLSIVYITIFAAVLATSSTIVRADTTSEYHETFQVGADTPVTVKNTNGTIDVATWDEDYVDVRAELRSQHGQDEIDLVHIAVTVNGGMSIETVMTRREGGSFLDRLFGSVSRWPRVDVNYTIKLPRNVRLEAASTVNGSVELENTRGTTRARTTNGQVRIEGHSGELDASTTNGNIIIRGEVALREAGTTNGSIDADIGGVLTGPATISTVNGSVHISLPADIDANLDVKTVNGSIQANGLTMRVESITRNHMAGVLGDGGPGLSIRTVNGSVNLEIR